MIEYFVKFAAVVTHHPPPPHPPSDRPLSEFMLHWLPKICDIEQSVTVERGYVVVVLSH